jgi:hypothetical protein
MHAQIAPCEELATRSPHDKVFAEHSGRDRTAARELFDQGDWVPVLDQYRVIDHRQSSTGPACGDDATRPE